LDAYVKIIWKWREPKRNIKFLWRVSSRPLLTNEETVRCDLLKI